MPWASPPTSPEVRLTLALSKGKVASEGGRASPAGPRAAQSPSGAAETPSRRGFQSGRLPVSCAVTEEDQEEEEEV